MQVQLSEGKLRYRKPSVIMKLVWNCMNCR